MDEDENKRNRLLLLKCMVLILKVDAIEEEETKKHRRRTYWVHNDWKMRPQLGYFHSSFLKLRDSDPCMFFNFCRMYPPEFDLLANLVRPMIAKRHKRHFTHILKRCVE